MHVKTTNRNPVVTLSVASLGFVLVFWSQYIARRSFNWPPHSIPELIISAPVGAFISGHGPSSGAAYLLQGSLSWALLGAFVGLLASCVPLVRRSSVLARLIFFGALAFLVLAASFVLFPVPQGSGGITPFLRWLRAHGLKY